MKALLLLTTLLLATPGYARTGAWDLCSIKYKSGRVIVPRWDITLEFDGRDITGYGGCNEYQGRFVDRPGKPFDEILWTERGCEEEGRMDLEERYFRHFINAKTVVKRGERLVITTNNGTKLRYARPGEC